MFVWKVGSSGAQGQWSLSFVKCKRHTISSVADGNLSEPTAWARNECM